MRISITDIAGNVIERTENCEIIEYVWDIYAVINRGIGSIDSSDCVDTSGRGIDNPTSKSYVRHVHFNGFPKGSCEKIGNRYYWTFTNAQEFPGGKTYGDAWNFAKEQNSYFNDGGGLMIDASTGKYLTYTDNFMVYKMTGVSSGYVLGDIVGYVKFAGETWNEPTGNPISTATSIQSDQFPQDGEYKGRWYILREN